MHPEDPHERLLDANNERLQGCVPTSLTKTLARMLFSLSFTFLLAVSKLVLMSYRTPERS
jgi:hypothetical protein